MMSDFMFIGRSTSSSAGTSLTHGPTLGAVLAKIKIVRSIANVADWFLPLIATDMKWAEENFTFRALKGVSIVIK